VLTAGQIGRVDRYWQILGINRCGFEANRAPD
jgi:hypothetical protein